MKILVLGANGFIGKAVVAALSSSHEVFSASREPNQGPHHLDVDLLSKESISKALGQVRPDVIINCAGVVENNSAAEKNIEFTKNLLDEVVRLRLLPKAIVICGSAAEYGVTDRADIPVKETAPLNASNDYGVSKREESRIALDYGEKFNLKVIVLRIFNPIGTGMHPKFLIPGIARQVADIERGEKKELEVSRLDSERDYIDVADVAAAIKLIIEGHPKHRVYNIGSGVSTSNEQLIDLALKYSSLKEKPPITETFKEPEPIYAKQADINRIKKEFNWEPASIIEETVKEAMNDSR
jgi:GDP-4-dehydro-6-deoxy-D-mannose reductase